MELKDLKPINNFEDFIEDLKLTGMTTGGGNNEGVFSLADWYSNQIVWHTEEPATDPWEWRMRVLNERNDIAYAKLFFKKSGFITKEWYPYYYAARRAGKVFEEEYEDGKISFAAKTIYELLSENDSLPLHMLKQLGGFGKEEKSRFDSAITELQMKMYITMCGRACKVSNKGQEYGWSSTVFCLVENFFEKFVFDLAENMATDEAYQKLEEHLYQLNPKAEKKKIRKWILG